MRSKIIAILILSTLVLMSSAVVRMPLPAAQLKAPNLAASRNPARLHDQAVKSFLHLPLRFEKNQGQADSHARFISRGPGYSVFLTSNEAVLALGGKKKAGVRSQESEERRNAPRASLDHVRDRLLAHEDSALVRMKLAGANPAAVMEGIDPLPGKSNYLLGNDPAAWCTGVEAYAKVMYRDVYPGVNLIYYGNPQQLEYDFVVAPGASPRAIQMQITGADAMRLDPAGDLTISAGSDPVRLHKPVIYQEENGGRREIAGGFRLLAKNMVGFDIGSYDPRVPLVIDPVLAYSTFLGGTGDDEINAITLDSDGNIYVAGFTTSADFPTASAFRGAISVFEDAFVSKLSADGSQLVFSTYLGGNNTDIAQGLAVDSSGNVTVAGYTGSTNFPTAAPFQASNRGGADAFVTRLNSSGTGLIYSTYLGGSSDDFALAVAIDASGSAYIAGLTSSSNLTVVNPFQNARSTAPDAFVAKLSPGGNALVYSTYLGGNNFDQAQGIAVDSSGSAYVTGLTASSNFPRSNAFQNVFGGGTCVSGTSVFTCADVFVAKFNPSGTTLAYSTYLGGNGEDAGNSIALDSSGNAYVTGSTNSGNFPTLNSIQGTLGGLTDAFLTKLGSGGNILVYSTYLGGIVSDQGDGIAVDASGDAYVTGGTGSSDFPTLNSIQTLTGSVAFVSKMNPAGSALLYSTYLGGSSGDQGIAIAVGATGAYVAGATASSDFPVVNPFQGAFAGGTCFSGSVFFPCPEGFISKLALDPKLFTGGVVNGASFAPSSAVAAGSIVSGFGTDLTSATAFAGTIPLPTTLANLSVRMNGTLAPLFYASGIQINMQVPWELAGQSQATVQVSSGGSAIAPITVNLATAAPGIFSLNSSGGGQGAILISATSEYAAPVGSVIGSGARPANRGEFVTIYLTGLGPVTNRPATGAAAGSNSNTLTTPVVTIGGIQAATNFSGLAPTFVGLYQINAQVPANAQVGNTVPVVVSLGGAASNTVQMAIQ